MTLRRDAPASLIVATIIVVAALMFATSKLFSGLTEKVEASQFELMQSIVTTALRDASSEALARADMIAALPVTRQALAAKDRDRLLAEFSGMFAIERQRHGVDQAQFHVPPAQSLLRLHSPTQFGDDLTRFRPLVLSANREHAARQGVAMAQRGPAIFGVAPVSNPQGNPAGTFEIGLDFGALLDRLKAAYGLDFALFIEEKPLREFARGVSPEILSDQNRVGRFIRFHATNDVLMRALAGDADISAVNAPVQYARDAGDTPYGVLLMPLRDGAGVPLGVIVTARDFSGSRAAASRSLITQIWMAGIAIIVLAGVIIVVIRGFLLRPLEVVVSRFEALDAGQPSEPIPDSGSFCVEISRLADIYERIRSGGRNRPS